MPSTCALPLPAKSSTENLFGWKDYEAIGKRLETLLVSKEHHVHFQNIRERLSFEQPWSGQFPFKRRSGETFMAMTTLSLLYEDGELVGVITVSSDATHFNSIALEDQTSNQGSANRPPRGTRLNSKRIQWHPSPQIISVPQIASSVANLAQKLYHIEVWTGTHIKSAARRNDADTEDELFKKPVKLKSSWGKKGQMQEHDESCEQDGYGGTPESSSLLDIPGTSKASTSSQGTVYVQDRKENPIEKNSSVSAAEGEYSFANRSMGRSCAQTDEKECCLCFNLPKPEDLVPREGSTVSEKMGRKNTLQKEGEMTDKAQKEHDERHCSSSGESTGSHGSASSRGDSELSSLCDCVIHWEDLQIGEEIGQGSYAVVHHGIWKGSDVAVKIYYANEYERVLEDYKKEIDIMKRLRHPNVLIFMGAVYSQERLAIVTEFLPRGFLFVTPQYSLLVNSVLELLRGIGWSVNYIYR